QADRSSLGSDDPCPLRSAGSGGDRTPRSGALAPRSCGADPGEKRLARRLSIADWRAQPDGAAGDDEGADAPRIEAPPRRSGEEIGPDHRRQLARELARSQRARLRSRRLEELAQACDAAFALEEDRRIGPCGYQRRPSRG